MSNVGMPYTPPTIEQLNDTIAAERQRANDAWAAAQMEREVADAYQADARRYRFLRNTPPWKSPVVAVMARSVGDDIAMLGHDALDVVIDQAIHAAGNSYAIAVHADGTATNMDEPSSSATAGSPK